MLEGFFAPPQFFTRRFLIQTTSYSGTISRSQSLYNFNVWHNVSFKLGQCFGWQNQATSNSTWKHIINSPVRISGVFSIQFIDNQIIFHKDLSIQLLAGCFYNLNFETLMNCKRHCCCEKQQLLTTNTLSSTLSPSAKFGTETECAS